MKNPIYAMAFILMLFCTLNEIKAQQTNSKPKIFTNYADEIICNQQALDVLFTQEVNTPVNVQLSPDFTIVGTLTYSEQKYSNLKSLIIRLTNFPNVIFSISRLSDIYTPEKYVGRLISSSYSDGYEVILENNIYKLKKVITDRVIQPCHQ